MFSEQYKKIRESVYGITGTSVLGKQVTVNNGTAFMVAPGILATAAHLVHIDNDSTKPVHQIFEIIRIPDIGKAMEKVSLIAEDTVRDIALFKIEGNKTNLATTIKKDISTIGETCGFVGFPLSSIEFVNNNKILHLTERFQSAFISAHINHTGANNRQLFSYEIDRLMYPGSSGCPGFNANGEIIGMQVASLTHKSKENDQTERVAISLVVPSMDIIDFLKKNNII